MDIDKMEAGREMDALVAEKVMGEDVFFPVGHSEPVIAIDECRKGIRRISNYSTDISATMPVLEWLRSQHYSTTIYTWDHTNRVVIVCSKRQGLNENIPDLEVDGNTLPETICRAALKAMEIE